MADGVNDSQQTNVHNNYTIINDIQTIELSPKEWNAGQTMDRLALNSTDAANSITYHITHSDLRHSQLIQFYLPISSKKNSLCELVNEWMNFMN